MSIGLEEYRIVRSIGIIGIVLCYLSTLDYVRLKKKEKEKRKIMNHRKKKNQGPARSNYHIN